ncbi:hypothetical protein ACS0TY_005646 [Phlomoides rotata]
MLPILLTLLFSLSFTSAQKQCPKCGSMEVPYPLSTSQDCGLPNYSLSCDEGMLNFVSVDNFTYKVESISPETDRLIIEPPNIEQNTCLSSDLPLNGLRIDDSSPFNISKSNTVMLFNCSDNLLLSPLNCSSISPCRRLLDETEAGGCGRALCCSYLKDASMTSRQIRVRVGGCTAYTSIVDFKPDQSVEFWNFGIELQWLPPN